MKKKTFIAFGTISIIAVAIVACKKNKVTDDEVYSSEPVLPSTPYDYEQSTNDNLATLGRVLFYEKQMSLNNSIACASCHQQGKAFTDNLQFSTGLTDQKTLRNTPSIFAKSGRMFWDGRSSGIQDIVLRPIQNHVEMRFEDLEKLSQKLSKVGYYNNLFVNAFGDKTVTSIRIQLALSNFLQNFTFSKNKFNSSRMGGQSLNSSEKIGQNIFFGIGKCSNCHHVKGDSTGLGTGNGYGFTDMNFNIGLDETYSDNGVGAITNLNQDNGKFMVPALTNVELTAPYMHDGRFKTLEEVVEHYNSGIKNHPNLDFELRNTKSLENLSNQEVLDLLDINNNGIVDNEELVGIPVNKLNLSDTEKKGLVDFLKSLTDKTILSDKRFSNPFKR